MYKLGDKHITLLDGITGNRILMNIGELIIPTPPTPPIVGTDWTKVNEWLPTLEVGDTSISCPTCSGFMPITLQVVDKDTISCDGYDHTVTFQFNNVLTNKDGSAYTMAFNYLDIQPNRYMQSKIRDWLAVPPNINKRLQDRFVTNDDGTQKTGEDLVQAEAFLNAIQTPTLSVAYYDGIVLQGQETFNDKFWLPSYTQLGGIGSTYCEVEDKCLSYFKDESGNPIGDPANDKRVRIITGEPVAGIQILLRTANRYFAFVFSISSSGKLQDNTSVIEKHNLVCPCLTLAYNN